MKRGIIQKIPSNYSENLYQVIQLMLQQDPRKRPTASQLLKNPIINQKLVENGLVDFVEIHKNLGQLMETIVIPGKLQNLQNHLPKKKSRAMSCSKIPAESELNKDSEELAMYRQNLNKMLRERKKVLEESQQNKRIPPL